MFHINQQVPHHKVSKLKKAKYVKLNIKVKMKSVLIEMLPLFKSSQHCNKRHLQLSMFFSLIIWDIQAQITTGTDQEPSIDGSFCFRQDIFSNSQTFCALNHCYSQSSFYLQNVLHRGLSVVVSMTLVHSGAKSLENFMPIVLTG